MNKLARSITKWTEACDKRLSRLISYIHHTCEYKQYCYVGNTAKQCRLGLFQDSHFAGDFDDSKSTSGGTLCVFGSITLVPISWMSKKQTSVSNSSIESEIISLDAGLRLDGISALDLWDLIVSVLGNTTQNHDRTGKLVVSSSEICSRPHTIHKRKQSQGVINDLDNVDFIPSNVQSSHQEALLYVNEDNEAVIKMSQSVQIHGYVFHDIYGPHHGQTSKTQWFLSNEICTDIHLLECYWKDNSRKFCWDLDWKKYQIGNVCVITENKDCACRYTWMIFKWLEDSRLWLPCGRN